MENIINHMHRVPANESRTVTALFAKHGSSKLGSTKVMAMLLLLTAIYTLYLKVTRSCLWKCSEGAGILGPSCPQINTCSLCAFVSQWMVSGTPAATLCRMDCSPVLNWKIYTCTYPKLRNGGGRSMKYAFWHIHNVYNTVGTTFCN
jgi:hypothetical protein